ncbi:hypothetical protein N7456_001696 [Penicillium angulare]|uniref:F-box domain-containing protein n=1 Tax=Penicillium angulare TaxID=116970 RepID=A0A9W9KPJ1_9EURO|nr:hypothetical protein N7456_001696 [Penicillium angulare]
MSEDSEPVSRRIPTLVRFNKRQYVHSRLKDVPDNPCIDDTRPPGIEDLQIVAEIPTDPYEYEEWLKMMRARYQAKENALERIVYDIRNRPGPIPPKLGIYDNLPCEFQHLYEGHFQHTNYIINLDNEVFTIFDAIHMKLNNIPRQGDVWYNAICDSTTYPHRTLDFSMISEEYAVSLALELRKPDWNFGYEFRITAPNTNITDARKAFLTEVLANTITRYKGDIVHLGAEWSPESFPFRELAFALVSIASDQVKFIELPTKTCGTKCNDEGGCEPPGVSPTETMYWFEGVLVNLSLVVDGKAMMTAARWGIGKGFTNFQIVVLSLFEVAFVEVNFKNKQNPFIKASRSMNLSPLRLKGCTSIHARERPRYGRGAKNVKDDGSNVMELGCERTINALRRHFPGLPALVNFFATAASRRATCKSRGVFPLEIYARILEFVDCDTWKSCSFVSTWLRSLSVDKYYRLNDQISIAAGPLLEFDRHLFRNGSYRRGNYRRQSYMCFDFENSKTNKILRGKLDWLDELTDWCLPGGFIVGCQ